QHGVISIFHSDAKMQDNSNEKEPSRDVSDPLVDENEQKRDDEPSNFKDIEAVLDHLGGAGRYNLLVLAAAAFFNVFTGMITLSANFTSAGVPFNCSDFGLDNVSLPDDCQSSAATNGSSAAIDSQCSVTFNCSSAMTEKLDKSDSLKLRTFDCQTFQFSEAGMFLETAVSRFGLVCQRAWMSNLATTFYFVGFLFGCSVYGALADRFGRQKMALVSLINIIVCTIAASQAPLLWLYWSLQLLTGLGIGGFMSSTFSLALESTTPAYRNIWGMGLHNGWTIGIYLGTLIAYFERRYNFLLLYYGLTVLAAIPPVLLLSESPRWLVSTRRYKQADSVLQRIARINRRSLGDDNFSSEIIALRDKSASTGDEGISVLQLLKQPNMRLVTCIVWVMFFNVSMAYYGIWLAMGNLGGSIYRNQLIAATIEIPSRLLGMLASYRINRRVTIIVTYGCAGVCLAATAFLFGESHLSVARISTAMTGKFWVLIAFDLTWLYSAEVFPTVVRSLGVGTGSTFARAGAMISTLVPGLGVFWRPLPFLIFSIGPLLVVLLALAVPETRGRRLPNSMEDGERLAKTSRCCRRRRQQAQDISDGGGDIEL
ncbi:hypothetical protein BOX15_Mlig020300g3, partial [Macrostomum lignano]